MSDVDPIALVRRGYDQIAQRYLDWSLPSPAREHCMTQLLVRLPAAAEVLELGCGACIPVGAALARHARYTGVDVSSAQIALARQHVPTATFLQADITTLDFPPATFDAVVAFYAITHVPREAHATLFARIARWLKPGGLFSASLGATDDPGTVEPGWLGAAMYFSHFDAATNRKLLHQAGLHVLEGTVIAEEEDGVPVSFLWVLASV